MPIHEFLAHLRSWLRLGPWRQDTFEMRNYPKPWIVRLYWWLRFCPLWDSVSPHAYVGLAGGRVFRCIVCGRTWMDMEDTDDD